MDCERGARRREPHCALKNGGWLIRPPEQRARTQGRLLPRGVFSLDAGFPIRVTPQQPKLLCSSHLGETCPYPCRCHRHRYVAGSDTLPENAPDAARPPRKAACGEEQWPNHFLDRYQISMTTTTSTVTRCHSHKTGLRFSIWASFKGISGNPRDLPNLNIPFLFGVDVRILLSAHLTKTKKPIAAMAPTIGPTD